MKKFLNVAKPDFMGVSVKGGGQCVSGGEATGRQTTFAKQVAKHYLSAVVTKAKAKGTNKICGSNINANFDRRNNCVSGCEAKLAFTMAEILLSLTIIGVVAAITLPSLTGNINERTWNTQRKALYARMSQAFALMPALNGFGTVSGEAGTSSRVDTAAETFVASGLSKVVKINNICDSEHLADCGIASSYNIANNDYNLDHFKTLYTMNSRFNSTDFDVPDTKAVAVETQNGESIIVYYNPKCQQDLNETSGYFLGPKMCVHMLFDLNGSKGPNTLTKDVGFISVFYPSDPVVVMPLMVMNQVTGSKTWEEASSTCGNLDQEYRLPNREEAMAIDVQNILPGSYYMFWTATMADPAADGTKRAYSLSNMGASRMIIDAITESRAVICVRRN